MVDILSVQVLVDAPILEIGFDTWDVVKLATLVRLWDGDDDEKKLVEEDATALDDLEALKDDTVWRVVGVEVDVGLVEDLDEADMAIVEDWKTDDGSDEELARVVVCFDEGSEIVTGTVISTIE